MATARDYELEMLRADYVRLTDAVKGVVRERDEARAEVSRLAAENASAFSAHRGIAAGQGLDISRHLAGLEPRTRLMLAAYELAEATETHWALVSWDDGSASSAIDDALDAYRKVRDEVER